MEALLEHYRTTGNLFAYRQLKFFMCRKWEAKK